MEFVESEKGNLEFIYEGFSYHKLYEISTCTNSPDTKCPRYKLPGYELSTCTNSPGIKCPRYTFVEDKVSGTNSPGTNSPRPQSLAANSLWEWLLGEGCRFHAVRPRPPLPVNPLPATGRVLLAPPPSKTNLFSSTEIERTRNVHLVKSASPRLI